MTSLEMTGSTLHFDTTRRISAVLLVDVVDSVRLTQLDETGTVERWRRFIATITVEELPKSGGRRVKLQGDGMLCEFESTLAAVECALAIQARLAITEAPIIADRRIRLRMGVHVTTVIADEFDLYGDGVNLAARLRDLAGAGEVVVSAAVRDQITDGLDVVVEDLGERRLKGFERPVRAFRVWPPGSLPTISRARTRHVGDRPAIAVLPLRNLSGDPRHDFLGDLVADDVIGELARRTDLFVISRLSTTPFRDRLYEPRNVAEVLGVRYVLSGSIVANDTRLRVAAELIEADSGHVVWADRIEGALANIFDLQDALTAEIAGRLVPQLRQIEFQRVRNKRPEVLTAYERMLRAIELLHRSSPDDLDRAQNLLHSAVVADPHYATPRAWLARLHVLRVGQGASADPKHDASEATRHVEAALERDGNDAWALSVHGLVAAYLQKDLELAMTRYDRALTINRSAVSALAWSASANTWLGNAKQATELIQRAIDLSPLDPHMYSFHSIAAAAHAAAGNYNRSIEFARQSLRENRGLTATHKVLSMSLALSGNIGEAKSVASELLVLEPGFSVNGFRQRYPGQQSSHVNRFCDGLRLAGVPQ